MPHRFWNVTGLVDEITHQHEMNGEEDKAHPPGGTKRASGRRTCACNGADPNSVEYFGVFNSRGTSIFVVEGICMGVELAKRDTRSTTAPESVRGPQAGRTNYT